MGRSAVSDTAMALDTHADLFDDDLDAVAPTSARRCPTRRSRGYQKHKVRAKRGKNAIRAVWPQAEHLVIRQKRAVSLKGLAPNLLLRTEQLFH